MDNTILLTSDSFSWLADKAENYYSQFGEYGLLAAIFERIGANNRWCLEVGASDGLFFSNTRGFIEQGWNAILIERDVALFKKLNALYAGSEHDSRVIRLQGAVEPLGGLTLDSYLKTCNAPQDIDLAVIDIDSADYHIFNSLLRYRPRVVMCEFDPNAAPDFIPPIYGEGQAGRDAIAKMGVGKLYYPVAQTFCNLIFVQQELLGLLIAKPVEVNACSDAPVKSTVKVGAVMSTPRLGFLANSDCVIQAVAEFGIPLARGEGAWWQHSLTRGIEKQLEAGCDYILTIDYDSAFHSSDVAKLVVFLEDNPGADVAVAMQQKREGGELLATSAGEVSLNAPGVPITVGHFGLTLFRRSVFERLSKPWFYERPDPKGSWNENRLDADMGFWENCQKSGVVVYLALDAVIGHLEQVVTWPGQDLKPHRQTMNDWRITGMRKPVSAFERTQGAVAAALNMGG